MRDLLRATIFFGIILIPGGCSLIDRSITRSLEEDKSYKRHVVEYHRKHPNKRNDGVTVTWSTADYIAMAIAKQNLQGEWAKPTDQLSFLPDNLKLDPKEWHRASSPLTFMSSDSTNRGSSFLSGLRILLLITLQGNITAKTARCDCRNV